MRKYKKSFRVDSNEVQGEGSFVIFKRLSWGEMRPLLDLKNEERAEAIIRACVLDWNWVDDEGNPLPNPQKDTTVLDGLISQEATWLMAHVDQEPTEDEAKN